MVALVAVFVVALTALGLLLGAYVVAVHRARTAADLAALATAHDYNEGGGEPCRIADTVARANGATVESCVVTGPRGAFAVTVKTAVAVTLRLPAAPATVSGWARAGTPAR